MNTVFSTKSPDTVKSVLLNNGFNTQFSSKYIGYVSSVMVVPGRLFSTVPLVPVSRTALSPKSAGAIR